MARRRVHFAPGECYHVYNRGCNKEQIFREEENYVYLKRLLNESLQKRHVSMIAYCLMPNHYHFLMRQETEIPISEVIHDVFNSYVKAFNKKYGRTGTLFEERFKVKHIEDDRYLIHLCRYIHRNPLEAGLVSEIGSWRHSDYPEWTAGKRNKESLWNLFSGPEDYAGFVLEYETTSTVAADLKNYMLD